ncbi:UvrD-helicase domain-containing protein [bacterium]|nr:UvrD-helicase domain-containing protein [bacterium]
MLSDGEILANLNDKQLAAVLHDEGPALVLAGAGSGKTRVLTCRVAYLLAHKKLNPDQILLVTFTNKAAAEMKARVQALTGLDLPMSGTFHSLAAKMLRQYAPAVNLPYNFTIYDSDDQLALLKQIYKNNGWDSKTYKPQAVRAAISEAKNHLLDPEQYRQTAYGDFGNFVANAYQAYQVNLKLEDAVDFDDLLNLALKMLQTDHHVRDKYQQQIEYVLIDEYQDTNTAQYQLSRLLAAPQNNLFVVGDFSQSIYAWRGADYHNMLHLKQDYPDLKTYHLDQNYRSIQPILTAATQIISHNTDHPILNLWTQNKAQDSLQLLDCETGELEAKTVASEINALRSQYALSDIAILYRTNAQSRAFEEALTRQGIPYRLVGGFKFYERKEVKDLLAYLRLFANPKESVSVARVQKIGKRRYQAYLNWRDQLSEEDRDTLGPGELLQQIITATKYLDLYDRQDPEDAVKLENITELIAHASQFNSVSNFLENVALIQDDYGPDGKRVEEDERDEVTLMSLHSAKGLEFSVVFLVGMEENLLPHSRSLFDAEALAEERRLCYVGITRAKKKLYFSHCHRRWTYGGTSTVCRSRFLDDLDPELLEVTHVEDLADRRVYPWQQNRHGRFGNSSHSSTKQSSQIQLEEGRTLDLDDSQLDAFLDGDLDPEAFLRS